jgi:hypothetical protein
MPRPLPHLSVAAAPSGPLFIGIGLAVVLAAQLWPAVPIAAAIALIGLGATLTLADCRQHGLVLMLNFAIYAALVGLAIAAQWNLRNDAITLIDAIVAFVITYKSATADRA